MNVLFVHPSYPGQFGVLAILLATRAGWDCTYLTATPCPDPPPPLRFACYPLDAAAPGTGHPASLEQHLAHAEAARRGALELRDRHGLRPDIVVGHACAGSYYYLKSVFDCPVIGYFDFLPPPFWSDAFVLRPEYPPPEDVRLANARASLITYGQLEIADALVTPTRFQLSTMPPAYRGKARVIFDCAALDLAAGTGAAPPAVPALADIAAGERVVTYVSRGLEAIRGFDVFMRVAKRLCDARDDVRVLVAGEPVSAYGYETRLIDAASFKAHVLAGDDYDLQRIRFLGRVPAGDLAALLARSDLHVYLTVPYVLSWSCLHAMAAGCVVLGSDTPPVREVMSDGETGLLAGFHDVEGLTAKALDVLAEPQRYRHLGAAARARVARDFALEHTFAGYRQLIEEVARDGRA